MTHHLQSVDLRTHLAASNHASMRSIARVGDLRTSSTPDVNTSVHMSRAVLEAAERVARELRALQDEYILMNYKSGVPASSVEMNKSWGQLVVFDSLFGQLQGEVEAQVRGRGGVSDKRAALNEKATQNWQQALVANRMSKAADRSRRSALETKRNNAASMIQVVWRQYRIRSVFGHEIKKKWKKLRKVTKVEMYQEAMAKVSGARKLAARNALASRRQLEIFGDLGSGSSDSEDEEEEALGPESAAAAAEMFGDFGQPARQFADVSDEEEEVRRGRKFVAAEDRQVSAEWEAPQAPKLRKGRTMKQAAVRKRLEELAKPHNVVTRKKDTEESPSWGVGRARRARLAGKVSVALKSGHTVEVDTHNKAARTLHDLAKKTELMQSAVRNFQKLDGVLEEWVTTNRDALDGMIAAGDAGQLDSMGDKLMADMEEKYRAGEFLVAVAAMWKSLKKSLLSAQKALHVIPEPEEVAPEPSPDEPDHEARVAAFQRSRTLAKSRRDEIQLMVHQLEEGQDTKLWHHISREISAASVVLGRVEPLGLVRRSVVKVNRAKAVLGKLAAQRQMAVPHVTMPEHEEEMEEGALGAASDVFGEEDANAAPVEERRKAFATSGDQSEQSAVHTLNSSDPSFQQDYGNSPMNAVDCCEYGGSVSASSDSALVGEATEAGHQGTAPPSSNRPRPPSTLEVPPSSDTATGSIPTAQLASPKVASPASPASAPLEWGRRLSTVDDVEVFTVSSKEASAPPHGPSPLSQASTAPTAGLSGESSAQTSRPQPTTGRRVDPQVGPVPTSGAAVSMATMNSDVPTSATARVSGDTGDNIGVADSVSPSAGLTPGATQPHEGSDNTKLDSQFGLPQRRRVEPKAHVSAEHILDSPRMDASQREGIDVSEERATGTSGSDSLSFAAARNVSGVEMKEAGDMQLNDAAGKGNADNALNVCSPDSAASHPHASSTKAVDDESLAAALPSDVPSEYAMEEPLRRTNATEAPIIGREVESMAKDSIAPCRTAPFSSDDSPSPREIPHDDCDLIATIACATNSIDSNNLSSTSAEANDCGDNLSLPLTRDSNAGIDAAAATEQPNLAPDVASVDASISRQVALPSPGQKASAMVEMNGDGAEAQLPSLTARNIAQLPPMAQGGAVLASSLEADDEGRSSSSRRASDTAVGLSQTPRPQRASNGAVQLEPLDVPEPHADPLSPDPVDVGAAILLSSPSPSQPSPVSQLAPLEVPSPTGGLSTKKPASSDDAGVLLSTLSPPSKLSPAPLYQAKEMGEGSPEQVAATAEQVGSVAKDSTSSSPFASAVRSRSGRNGTAEKSDTGAEVLAAAMAPVGGAVAHGAATVDKSSRKHAGSMWGTSLQHEEDQVAALTASVQRRAILDGMRRGRTEDGAISAMATRSERGGFSGIKPKVQHTQQAVRPFFHSDDSVLDRPGVRPPSPAVPVAGGVAPMRASAASRLRGGGGTQSQRQLLASGASHHSPLQSSSLRSLSQPDAPPALNSMQGGVSRSRGGALQGASSSAQDTGGSGHTAVASPQPAPIRSLHDLASLDPPELRAPPAVSSSLQLKHRKRAGGAGSSSSSSRQLMMQQQQASQHPPSPSLFVDGAGARSGAALRPSSNSLRGGASVRGGGMRASYDSGASGGHHHQWWAGVAAEPGEVGASSHHRSFSSSGVAVSCQSGPLTHGEEISNGGHVGISGGGAEAKRSKAPMKGSSLYVASSQQYGLTNIRHLL